jgi:nucleotide-binding universal stress UspA family protein
MFDTIVVGTDGKSRSRQAVETAAQLARTHSASLHLVHAFRSTLQMAGAAGDPTLGLAATTDADVEAAARERVGELAKAVGDGLEVQTYCIGQQAAAAILSVADNVDADLIVVGNRGMAGARRVLGSVPNSVAHGARCAVLIVPTS